MWCVAVHLELLTPQPPQTWAGYEEKEGRLHFTQLQLRKHIIMETQVTDDRRLDDRLGPFRFPGCFIRFIALTLLCF